MYAVEFQTKIKNGMIEIPKEYIRDVRENVKVILLMEQDTSTESIIERLLQSPIKVKHFTPLTREDMYDRT